MVLDYDGNSDFPLGGYFRSAGHSRNIVEINW